MLWKDIIIEIICEEVKCIREKSLYLKYRNIINIFVYCEAYINSKSNLITIL